MSSATSSSSSSSPSVFEIGAYATTLLKIDEKYKPNSPSYVPPPKPILIATPWEEGDFPLLVFLHGYLLYNSFYSQLIQHIASHGVVVIAPQLYILAGPDATEEVKSTAAVISWLSKGLQDLLPPKVHPNLTKVGLAGHSRGGKVAFALSLGKTTPAPKLSALIGIDPVDGMAKGKQTPPPVLTYVPHSFDLNMAAMVIGSGLGEVKKNTLFPPCAPTGVNHEDFYDECRKPACYLVAKDYGHLDMLDDETRGVRGKFTHCLCKNGDSREPMRRFVGGVVVAFLKGYLEDDFTQLFAIRDRQIVAPVEFQKMDFQL